MDRTGAKITKRKMFEANPVEYSEKTRTIKSQVPLIQFLAIN